MARKKNVTFNDIAQYTHFSKTTISRYFNNPDSLTPENQQIISDALDKLNYKENKVAKILANGQTEFVGVLIPSLSMNYYSEMLNQILASYEKYGYKFLVFAGNGHDETEHRYIQELMSYKIEGLIVLSHTLSSRELSDLQIPVVAIEREDQFVSSVNTDNYLGAYEATSLLIHNHCDVLIHLNSPTKENVPAYRRLAGFQDACIKAGVPHKVIIRDFGLSYQEAAAPLQEIFDNIEQKYAGQKKGIFLSNDDHANILLNLLIRKYHTLPNDYELIGFDGAPISEQAIYPISTVGQQIDQIADEAVSLLVSQMQERKKRHPVPLAEPVHKTVPPLLIRRQTVLLHNRVHVAADKTDIREPSFQFSVNVIQIASHKMMQTYRKKQNGFRMISPLVQHIGYALDGQLLQIAVQKILFFHNYIGKTVCRIHFRSRQYNTPHTVLCTDIDLYRLRNLHSRMYNIPVTVYRRIIFQL